MSLTGDGHTKHNRSTDTNLVDKWVFAMSITGDGHTIHNRSTDTNLGDRWVFVMSVTGGGHTMHNRSKATNLADRWVRCRRSCRSHRRWSSTAAHSAHRWHRSRSGTVMWGLHNTQDSEEASPCMTGFAVSSNCATPVTIRVPL